MIGYDKTLIFQLTNTAAPSNLWPTDPLELSKASLRN